MKPKQVFVMTFSIPLVVAGLFAVWLFGCAPSNIPAASRPPKPYVQLECDLISRVQMGHSYRIQQRCHDAEFGVVCYMTWKGISCVYLASWDGTGTEYTRMDGIILSAEPE